MGKYVWADGERYEGQFVNDHRTGQVSLSVCLSLFPSSALSLYRCQFLLSRSDSLTSAFFLLLTDLGRVLLSERRSVPGRISRGREERPRNLLLS